MIKNVISKIQVYVHLHFSYRAIWDHGIWVRWRLDANIFVFWHSRYVFAVDGEENLHAKIMKEKTVKSTLATHVLHVMLVEYTGFRFPVCHYPTCGVKASELHRILWSTIKKLHDWCFPIDYIVQDRGEENIQFIISNFDGDELDK